MANPLEYVNLQIRTGSSDCPIRGLAAEGGDVPGIYEDEYLALQCITARNQRGIKKHWERLPWKLLWAWGHSIFRKDKAIERRGRKDSFDRNELGAVKDKIYKARLGKTVGGHQGQM